MDAVKHRTNWCMNVQIKILQNKSKKGTKPTIDNHNCKGTILNFCLQNDGYKCLWSHKLFTDCKVNYSGIGPNT